MKIYLVYCAPFLSVFDPGLEKINVLVSFYAVQSEGGLWRTLQANRDRFSIFLDSGAYSAFTRGKVIRIEDYIEFIRKTGVETYANLDVIGDAEATRRNQEVMEAAGLTPIPCFHSEENLDFLEYYCQHYDYIAIGGLAGRFSWTYNMRFVDSCFGVIKKYWPKKIHGFGVTKQDFLERFPWFSVDSSSWVASAGYGVVNQFSNRRWITQKTGDCRTTNLVTIRGVDRPGKKNWRERRRMNIKAYLKMQSYITDLWDKRGISWPL